MGATHTVIALKGKYKPEIAALKEAIAKSETNVEIFEMPTFTLPAMSRAWYRWSPESRFRSGACLWTLALWWTTWARCATCDALQGENVTWKYLSVVGEVREPIMLHVPIGTHLTDCIEKAKPNRSDYAIIVGGPMMGKVLTDASAIESAVVTKTTGNIIVLPKDHYLMKRATLPISAMKHQARAACIQCRMCTDLCPRYLIGHNIRPNLVMRNVWREDEIESNEEFKACFGEAVNCCDCGVCEMFACPMGLSPRKINSYMKGKLRERGIQVERQMDPQAREGLDNHRTPTERLVSRLGLSEYYNLHAHECFELMPQEVYIPFQQHIGKPAVPPRARATRSPGASCWRRRPKACPPTSMPAWTAP